MSNTVIKLKNSSVSGKTPTAGDLSYGELALNFNDGRLYFKNVSDTIQYFAADVGGAGADIFLTDTDLGLVSDGSLSEQVDLDSVTVTATSEYDLGQIAVGGYVAPTDLILPSKTVSQLGDTAPGAFVFVTDETGGSIPAFYDGTNWRRVSDRQIVS